MIRVILFLTLVCLIALGFAWVADRPGEVAVSWLGYRVETSLLVAAVAVATLAMLIVLAWSVGLFLLRSPGRIAAARQSRRRRQGQQAISRGLIAIGAGDARAAKKHAGEAGRVAPAEPLALLLAAQTAQLHGDRAGAEASFLEMADHPETRLIGLRGLYVEARRRDDPAAARGFAEEAAKSAPALPWAGQAVLEFRCADGDWDGALKILDRNLQNALVDKPTWRRHRAVLMTARALALEATDRETAKTLALEAIRLAPDLVPAAALVGRLLADGGEIRKAGRIIEAAWRLNPHPDFAEIFAHLRIADSARERLARVEALVRQPPGHPEGRLALARAALDAREFAAVRGALEPLIAEPTQRVCMLMAELEEVEHGDTGRAREWMARALRAARDPAWTADGIVSDRWLPVSPVSGRIDAFQWKVPVAELTGPSRVIEQPRAAAPAIAAPAAPVAAPAAAAAVAAPAAVAPPVEPEEPEPTPAPAAETPGDAPPLPPEPPAPPAGSPPVASQSAAASATTSAPRTTVPPVRPVIPLVPVPDDPGPEEEPLAPPATEPRQDGRRGLGRLFR
jgi:HemY protein